MIDCVSVANMRQSDAYTIANYVSSLELMYRAAWGVYKAVTWKGRTAIVVGSGNNGGDGFALSCILQKNGYDCTVFMVSSNLSEDSSYYAKLAYDGGIPIQCFTPGCLEGYDILVDCLLGTGFQGSLRENYRCAIEAINASGAYVISVDENGPAAQAGVQAGDIIVEVNGTVIATMSEMTSLIGEMHEGDEVRVKVFRPDTVTDAEQGAISTSGNYVDLTLKLAVIDPIAH